MILLRPVTVRATRMAANTASGNVTRSVPVRNQSFCYLRPMVTADQSNPAPQPLSLSGMNHDRTLTAVDVPISVNIPQLDPEERTATMG